jgi:hypothetical protein
MHCRAHAEKASKCGAMLFRDPNLHARAHVAPATGHHEVPGGLSRHDDTATP